MVTACAHPPPQASLGQAGGQSSSCTASLPVALRQLGAGAPPWAGGSDQGFATSVGMIGFLCGLCCALRIFSNILGLYPLNANRTRMPSPQS